jgi:hypothetical protein
MKSSYDEFSPITGNKCVLIEHLSGFDNFQKICMETGYFTTKDFFNLSEDFELDVPYSKELINSTKVVDELGYTWFRIIYIEDGWLLYPESKNDDVVWKLIKDNSDFEAYYDTFEEGFDTLMSDKEGLGTPLLTEKTEE